MSYKYYKVIKPSGNVQLLLRENYTPAKTRCVAQRVANGKIQREVTACRIVDVLT